MRRWSIVICVVVSLAASAWATHDQAYLFLFNEVNRQASIYLIGPDGVPGALVQTISLDSPGPEGRTSPEFYRVGDRTYLLLLEEGGGPQVQGESYIYAINDGGTIGNRILTQITHPRIRNPWWVNAESYTIGGTTYMMLVGEYRTPGTPMEGTAGRSIYRMNTDGSFGPEITAPWCQFFCEGGTLIDMGWNAADTFVFHGSSVPLLFPEIAGLWTGMYLFTVNEGSGRAAIFPVGSHGRILEIDTGYGVFRDLAESTYRWSPGWTTARAFNVGTNLYLFFLKAGDGTVHIHEIHLAVWGTLADQLERDLGHLNRSGSSADEYLEVMARIASAALSPDLLVQVGPMVASETWTSGWTTAEFFTMGPTTYLLTLKEGDGTMAIARMNPDGTIGTVVHSSADPRSGRWRADVFTARYAPPGPGDQPPGSATAQGAPAGPAGADSVPSGCFGMPISIGQTVHRSLEPTSCRSSRMGDGTSHYAEFFAFTASAGDRISISLRSNSLDSYLYLIGPDGQVVSSDDDGGGAPHARIPAGSGFITLPAYGNYTIEVTTYVPNETGTYTLALEGSATGPSTTAQGAPAGPAGTDSVPSGCFGMPISIGQTVHRSLEPTSCRSSRRGDGTSHYAEFFAFTASAGDRISLSLRSNVLDSYLYLIGPDGQVVSSDDDGGGAPHARIPAGSGFITLPASGNYTIEVTTYVPNETGTYTLALEGSGM